jgi:hypothetical protein
MKRNWGTRTPRLCFGKIKEATLIEISQLNQRVIKIRSIKNEIFSRENLQTTKKSRKTVLIHHY